MKKKIILFTIVGFLMSIISCSKDDDIQTDPKVENPNYLRDVAGNFEIKNGLYLKMHGTLGASHTSYILSAQENNIGIYFCWEVPTDTSQIGTFDVSYGFYINPNEALFGQNIKGTVTIDKIRMGTSGVRTVLLEGSYSFQVRSYNLVMLERGGTFHYEGEYPREY